jgi:DNA-directed RNA polymerase specialized sigma24 family protein
MDGVGQRCSLCSLPRPRGLPSVPFPNTRHTLIQRLAAGGNDSDWGSFLADYWGPICRFALRRGNIPLPEAEDIASQTFEAVLRNGLLGRWVAAPQAKLRTLLCNVVCKVQANARRASANRQALLRELQDAAAVGGIEVADEDDAFLEAWVEDLLEQSLEKLAAEYHCEGKGDYFRVLYGRLCENMSIAEVATALEISPANVDNYYRHVRQRLGDKLQAAVRSHVYRYAAADEAEREFVQEWGQLGAYLSDHGGLEEAVRRTYDLVEVGKLGRAKPQRIRDTLTRIEAAGTGS